MLRNGAEQDISGEAGANFPRRKPRCEIGRKGNGSASSALSGVSVENLDAGSARALELSPQHARRGGDQRRVPQAMRPKPGLAAGDVIQEVNRKPVRNTSDFERPSAARRTNLSCW